MRFSLDYPGVNCRQCGTNFIEDEIEPDCEDCPVKRWDEEVNLALQLYDRACIWGELDHDAINQALKDVAIPSFHYRKYRRCVIALHRLMRKDASEKQCQTAKPE
ncbi:hypothetical protein [Desulfopila inferna]|uniref:hypothetical protein n=1 Tax=Desulfopila inferna TaxID=468528 RepID=UPI0019625737|nr:hypothetical protein [Desulfopila inferna]MBM9605970.1 hypothetical protein [Desulfopila inferna]